MSYDYPREGETRAPKHTHYVSNLNNTVYPAMQNLPGYEDDNPTDWRPATAAEISAYKAGNDRVGVAPGEADVQPLNTVTRSAPAAIKLADEDEADAGDTASADVAAPSVAIAPPPVVGAKAAF